MAIASFNLAMRINWRLVAGLLSSEGDALLGLMG